MGAGGKISQQTNVLFPDYRRHIALRYVKRGYALLVDNIITLMLIPVAVTIMGNLMKMYQLGELSALWVEAKKTNLQFNLLSFTTSTFLLAIILTLYFFRKRSPVYLLDFACYKPDESCKLSHDDFMEGTRKAKTFSAESIEFQKKVIERSGLGQNTYLPPAISITWSAELQKQYKDGLKVNLENARLESETVIFNAIEDALQKTNLKPSQIGILIVNCSLFSPTPSLCAMVINHFKMNENVISYNLSGMGCSAGLLSLDLARQLLQVMPNQYALVVSTENITQNWYLGNDRSQMLQNALFRMGGAAMVLSNKKKDRWGAKYELQHLVRTHMGYNDQAYSCVYETEDSDGIRGVKLTKELMAIAGIALKNNVTTLGPLVLPVSEQLLFFVSLILRKVFKKKILPYIPDFKTAFDHICIHVGGKKVVEEIEKQLALTKEYTIPNYSCLDRYGNTSSASIWYTLAYIEQFKGIKRGEKVWQLGFGSGFKCNSAVWKSLKTNQVNHKAWQGYQGIGQPILHQ